jgi:hypothetical protein
MGTSRLAKEEHLVVYIQLLSGRVELMKGRERGVMVIFARASQVTLLAKSPP